ncbi:hypothetical protein [Sphingomonas sp.]
MIIDALIGAVTRAQGHARDMRALAPCPAEAAFLYGWLVVRVG